MALIDREELLKTLDSYELTKWYHGDLITIIFDAPTVDAVEVVRCKDCKYYGSGVCWNESFTGYCSYGKRRDGE